jgi:hypothetical protein
VLGTVLEWGLGHVPYDRVQVVQTGLHDLTTPGQLGGAVCEVCEDVTVDTTTAAQFQLPAAGSREVALDGLLPAVDVGPVE